MIIQEDLSLGERVLAFNVTVDDKVIDNDGTHIYRVTGRV